MYQLDINPKVTLDVSLVADAMMQHGEETVDFLSGINNPPA